MNTIPKDYHPAGVSIIGQKRISQTKGFTGVVVGVDPSDWNWKASLQLEDGRIEKVSYFDLKPVQ
jgi:hypothetical protein